MKSTLIKLYTLVIIICFLFQGCTSYKQVKEMKVDKSVKIENVRAKELSACVWELMKENGGQIYHRSYDPIRNKWFIIAEYRTLFGGGNGDFNFSISFEDMKNKKIVIELRSLKTIWGSTQAPAKRIFQQIKQCQIALQ